MIIQGGGGSGRQEVRGWPFHRNNNKFLHFWRQYREEHSLMVSINELSQKEVEDRGVGGFTMKEKA